MAGQKKVNSNVEVKKVVETKPVPVETKPVQVETKPVSTPAKKGGKTAPVVAAPVPVPVAATVTAPAKKGGKASKETPVVAEPLPVATPAKKGGKASKETPVVVAASTTPVKKGGKAAKADTTTLDPVVATPKKGGKAPKVSKVVKVAKKVVGEDSQDDEGGDDKKHVRSFKVRLPGSEAFEGRFTGLTPYQAANKALSKYYRESNELQKEVTFSICESTRNSRKSTYTYVGGRHELSTPVTYTIADGRLITKKYKNVLKKVKKTEEIASH